MNNQLALLKLVLLGILTLFGPKSSPVAQTGRKHHFTVNYHHGAQNLLLKVLKHEI